MNYDFLKNKVNLGFFPTPIEFLPRFSAEIGHEVYIKRDDQTGLATGGNKTRKLEFLMKDALDKGAETVITIGGQQSNHCRQTAAAAAKLGLQCILILRGYEPAEYQGNLLLDKMLGADFLFMENEDIFSGMKKLYEYSQAYKLNFYPITMGGSNEIGCLGYVNAMKELKIQELEMGFDFDEIYFPTSSGGTQAGMVLGKKIFDTKAQIIGISNDKSNMDGLPLHDYIFKIIKEAELKYQIQTNIAHSEIIINQDFNEAGYGVITENEISIIKKLAATEGIILDPVYTGRAFYGMYELLKKSKQKKKILFWHTGGQAANFSYSASF